MTEFFHDLSVNPFLINGLVAGVLAGLACGIIGPYVITKRIVFLAGAIAHIAVGGVGIALFLKYSGGSYFSGLEPVHGATAIALLAAIIIGVINEKRAEHADTLIGALWAVSMALGILLIKYTPGYQGELMSYLFGNLAYVTRSQLAWMAILDLVILATVLLFHKQFMAVCLDQQLATLQRVPVLAINLLLLCLVALTVICLTQVVGLILVIALLSLPAATVARFVIGMPALLAGATLLGILITTLPRIAVYGTAVSPESAIVLAAGGVYLVSLLMTRRVPE